jgi:HPt (histidine-containing phosphotransfer) domain-containing protein
MTFDDATLLSRVEGNKDLLRAMVDAFKGEAPQLLREIELAIRQGDGDALFSAAHALKGALAALEAHHVSQAAGMLETAGRIGDFSTADHLLATLAAEVTNLQAELALLLKMPVQ